MRNFLKRLMVVAAVLAVGLVAPVPTAVNAQVVNLSDGLFVQPFRARYVSHIVTAADTDHALYVKYFGPGGTSTTTLAVEADGNLTFVVNGAAYTGFECPVSGALGGVIDVSDAACNTLGEVVDTINATATSFSTGYFRAVIAAGTRAESSDAVLLADAADTEVTRPEGDILFHDSSASDDTQVGLWSRTDPRTGREFGIQNWLNGRKLTANPFEDTESVLMYLHEKITNAGTIGNIEVHCTVENYRDGAATSSEVDSVIYLEAGGATTVVGKIDEFLNAGGLHCQGGKLWARLLASGADTSAVEMFVTGFQRPLRP